MTRIGFIANAKTKNRCFSYSVRLCMIHSKDAVKHQDHASFIKLCKQGCKNYNYKWCCPPNAPCFEAYINPWQYLYVIQLQVPLKNFVDISNSYLRIKAANTMLKSRADRYVRALCQKEGKAISTGSCRLCKPCHYIKREKCAHPDIMAYSYEAMGINVDALVQECFNSRLLWYQKGSVPEYTSVVCGFLSNQTIPLKDLYNIYLAIVER